MKPTAALRSLPDGMQRDRESGASRVPTIPLCDCCELSSHIIIVSLICEKNNIKGTTFRFLCCSSIIICLNINNHRARARERRPSVQFERWCRVLPASTSIALN